MRPTRRVSSTGRVYGAARWPGRASQAERQASARSRCILPGLPTLAEASPKTRRPRRVRPGFTTGPSIAGASSNISARRARTRPELAIAEPLLEQSLVEPSGISSGSNPSGCGESTGRNEEHARRSHYAAASLTPFAPPASMMHLCLACYRGLGRGRERPPADHFWLRSSQASEGPRALPVKR